jgi:hypothetical protein
MKPTIGWTFMSNVGSSVFFDPISLASYRKKKSNLSDGVGACPAVKVYENRVIVVRSPYTFTIRAQKTSERLVFCPVFPDTEVQESILRSLIEFQPRSKWRSNDSPILQLSLPYVFLSDENTYVNQIEAPCISGHKNWSLIEGRFNIYDWQRPVNWSIEWVDTTSDLIIKRGQPLFSLLFETNNPDSTFDLKYIEREGELDKAIQSSTGVSKLMRGTFGLTKEAHKKRAPQLIK